MSENVNKSDTSEQAGHAAAASTPNAHSFDEYRKKVLTQLTDLGQHVDGIQTKLASAASQVRSVLEKELADIKAQHPAAFSKLEELRLTGDEGIDVLRSRLDKLAGDLEKAVTSFLGNLGEHAKKATAAASDTVHAAAKADAAPAAAPADKPADKPADPA